VSGDVKRWMYHITLRRVRVELSCVNKRYCCVCAVCVVDKLIDSVNLIRVGLDDGELPVSRVLVVFFFSQSLYCQESLQLHCTSECLRCMTGVCLSVYI